MEQLQTDLAAAQSALATVATDIANLNETTDPNDAVVTSMVTALEAAGYTVTAPAPADAPELPSGENTPAES